MSDDRIRVHICRFDTLDDLKGRARRDPMRVLAALREAGRFSAFEVDAPLGRTLTELQKRKLLRTTGGEYPWTEVEVTPEGVAALEAAAAAAPLTRSGQPRARGAPRARE